jgi:hypothetical protein
MASVKKVIERIVTGRESVDGAGVRLRRVIGSPALNHADPFMLLDEIRSENPEDFRAGFPTHPHRGIETVTYMVKGGFRHRDSRGGGGLLKDGDVQWMTAGRGILHSEMPETGSGGVWGYQLWLTLPRAEKYAESRYQHLDAAAIPRVHLGGAEVRVITGRFADRGGPAGTFFPVHYFDVRLEAEGVFDFPMPGGMRAYAYGHTGGVAAGTGGEEGFGTGDFAVFAPARSLRLAAKGGPAGFLFMAAAPLNEPIVRGGPFVMNTREELEKAFRDWEEGKIDAG